MKYQENRTMVRIQEVGNHPEVLKKVLSPECNLSVWQREVPEGILEFVSKLIEDESFRFWSCRGEILENNSDFFPHFPGKERDLFFQDLRFIYQSFVHISGSPSPMLHLTKIDRMQCPLFHVDFNQLRLLCTYRGTGTLWVPEEATDRLHLGCGRNDHVVKDLKKIQEVHQGSVAILKGERYPGNQGYGIVHKSPEVESGTFRLFLRIEN